MFLTYANYLCFYKHSPCPEVNKKEERQGRDGSAFQFPWQQRQIQCPTLLQPLVPFSHTADVSLYFCGGAQVNQFVKISFQSGPVLAQPSGQFPLGLEQEMEMQCREAKPGWETLIKWLCPTFLGGRRMWSRRNMLHFFGMVNKIKEIYNFSAIIWYLLFFFFPPDF